MHTVKHYMTVVVLTCPPKMMVIIATIGQVYTIGLLHPKRGNFCIIDFVEDTSKKRT